MEECVGNLQHRGVPWLANVMERQTKEGGEPKLNPRSLLEDSEVQGWRQKGAIIIGA